MTDKYITTDFGCAAFASLVKGCLVTSQKISRGRSRFTVNLNVLRYNDNGEEIEVCLDGDDLWNEWLLSEFYQFDELVRRFKKGSY